MRKFVVSAVAVLAFVAYASAEEFIGTITKYEDGKITFKKFGKDKKAEETTLKVAANVKIVKGKFNKSDEGFKVDADGDYEGGKDMLVKAVKEAADKAKDAGDKGKGKGFGFGGGVGAWLVTDGDTVKEIRVMQGFGKKKKDAQ